MYAELAQSIMSAPWAFRAGVGHLLPLLLGLYCLHSLRGRIRTATTLPFATALFANGWLCWITAKSVATRVPGGVMLSVQLAPAIPVLLALVVATTANKRVCWQATFAATFWPLYLVDILCGQTVFGPDWLDVVHAVGGAGPLDGLVLVPLLTVILAGLIGRMKSSV